MKIDSPSVLICAETAATIATAVDYEALIEEFRTRFSAAPESDLPSIAASVQALEELRMLRDYWVFRLPKPRELRGLSDSDIAALAAGTPE